MKTKLVRFQDWESLARKARHKASFFAQFHGISLRALERIFEKQVQCSVRGWLVGTRIRHIRELLKTDLTMKEVAAIVGFDGTQASSTLCHFIKKHTGLTTVQFRKAAGHRHRIDTMTSITRRKAAPNFRRFFA